MARDSASRADNPSSSPEAMARDPASRQPGDRSGWDERRRGWFWHWNGIVTQYAPLIGLKGIGLLNSYTVWTDRREDSPHRGYAFPSQQSEANFYGEDRAELITINKILVALDLIEIRKEMVRKVDEKGRRWKVPQNLYRVKDRQDGIDLTTADVLRVIELADRDKAVYRHIRKIFSAKFEPIDRDNVWHQILDDLAEHPTWIKLASRAAKQEARASARTRAGHRARARQNQEDGDETENESADHSFGPGVLADPNETPGGEKRSTIITSGHDNDSPLRDAEQLRDEASPQPTTVASGNSGSNTAVEQANNGSAIVDESTNNGFQESERGSVASANNGHESSVEPGNTMYYEPSTTTTTITSPSGNDSQATGLGRNSNRSGKGQPERAKFDGERDVRDPEADRSGSEAEAGGDLGPRIAAASGGPEKRGLAGAPGGGPVGDPSPLVLSLYEAANDRPATGLERILLSELETDAGPPAEAAGSSGPDWIAAALREAVGSGSAFVAPKRIREIVNRWAATGSGPRGHQLSSPVNRHAGGRSMDVQGVFTQELEEKREDNGLCEVEVVAPREAAQGERLWGVVLDVLSGSDSGDNLLRLRGVVPVGERDDGRFVLGAPTRLAARLLEGAYRRPVEQALSSLLPSPVTIDILAPDQWRIGD